MNILDYTFENYCDGNCGLLDAHSHVKRSEGFKTICFGLIPSGFNFDSPIHNENVKIGLGFHPWSVGTDSDQDQLLIFEKHFPEAKYIGEIGLDFSTNHIDKKDQQLAIFYSICKLLGQAKDKVVSIHAVKSTSTVMEILKKTGADKNNIIIFHWFSGSHEELSQALKSGYYFSVGPKMLGTEKGYELIKDIPENKMFIETDLPWDNQEITAEEHLNLLNDFIMELRSL